MKLSIGTPLKTKVNPATKLISFVDNSGTEFKIKDILPKKLDEYKFIGDFPILTFTKKEYLNFLECLDVERIPYYYNYTISNEAYIIT